MLNFTENSIAMAKVKLDEIDHQILDMLIDNTRTPFTDIAKKLLISAGTVHVRVKKMEEAGIIKGSSLTLDYVKLGLQSWLTLKTLLIYQAISSCSCTKRPVKSAEDRLTEVLAPSLASNPELQKKDLSNPETSESFLASSLCG